MQNKFSRRNFIRMAVVGSSSLLLFPSCTNLLTKSLWRFFTEEEVLLVNAIVEQIIPADEWPGAKESGVTNFIDKQLVGPYARFQEKYRNGLASVKLTCQNLYHKQFEDLSRDEQTGFLEKMESGKLEDLDPAFFLLICDHTMQGFYGSPRHGGNKDYVSYRMIGLDYPLIIGQNRH